MLNKLASIIFIFLFAVNLLSQICDCKPATSDDTTRKGGNELITVIESRTYKSVQGIVTDVNDELLEGVLVEVFDEPDWIKENKYSPPEVQKRIHACITGKDGSFCFPKLVKGNYEVRFSKDVRWNPTYMFLKVNPNSLKASKKLIKINLRVGT